jgi:hypothetical protein
MLGEQHIQKPKLVFDGSANGPHATQGFLRHFHVRPIPPKENGAGQVPLRMSGGTAGAASFPQRSIDPTGGPGTRATPSWTARESLPAGPPPTPLEATNMPPGHSAAQALADGLPEVLADVLSALAKKWTSNGRASSSNRCPGGTLVR